MGVATMVAAHVVGSRRVDAVGLLRWMKGAINARTTAR
jgi:hypothetical protein